MATRIKTEYKDILEEFRQKVEMIKAETQDVPIGETEQQKKARIARLLGDYKEFTTFYFPHYCKAPTAKFHIKLANTLYNRKKCLLARKWARGHAKSVNGSVMIPIWLMFNKKLKFMVLCSNSELNAHGLLNDIKAEFEANARIIHDFGDLVGSKWETGDFKTKTNVRFKALGRGQSPRGLRNGANRPDYIVIDDADDDKLVQNPRLVKRAYDWVMGALYGCFPFEDVGRMVALGNLISTNSILQMLCDNPMFEVEQVDLLDSDGIPSWSENTELQIVAQERIAAMGYRLSQREYFNNPITEGSVYKQEWFQYKQPLPLKDYQTIVAYTDPSFKSSNTNDFKATVVLGKIGNEYHILKAFVQQTTVAQMVDWHYDLYKWALDNGGALRFYMEANFIQDLLLQDFDKAALERKYPIPVIGDKRHKPDKFSRIEAMSAMFERGFMYISTEQKDNANMIRMLEQFLLFEKGSKAPDDAPDAVEGCIYIINKMLMDSQPPIFIESDKKSSYRY